MLLRACLVLIAAALGAAPASSQTQREVIEDRGYCFRLTRPGPDWTLYDEHEVRRFAPDAVAGGMDSKGAQGFVVVELATSSDLSACAELVQSAITAKDKRVTATAKIEFLHEPAIRYELEGSIESLRRKWDSIVVIHRGFLYQIVSFDSYADFHWSMDALTPFQSAFSFLEGTPRARPGPAPTKDISGVDWEVKDGVYRNAAFGFGAAAKIPWRLIVGAELMGLSSDAELGFECAEPQIYVTIELERAHLADPASVIDVILQSFPGLQLGSATVTARALGKEVQLRQATSSTQVNYEFLCGVLPTRDAITKILAWYPRGQAARARVLVATGLASTRFLGSDEQASLLERLKNGPDSQNHVGRSYCLRHGVYQDFGAGFRWTQPPGLWRITTGEDAKDATGSCCIKIANDALGLSGSITAIDAKEPDLERYFGIICKSVFGEKLAAGLESHVLALGDVEGLTASATAPGETGLKYDLTLAVTSQRVIYIVLGGRPENVEAAEKDVDGVRNGLFVLEQPVKPVTSTHDCVRDVRLGYALRQPGEGWHRKHLSMGASDALGSGTGWWKGTEEIDVWAISPDTEGKDPTFLVDLMSNMMPSAIPAKSRGELRDTQHEYMGSQCKLTSWEDAHGLHSDVLYLVRDHTCYLLCATAPGTGDLHVVEECFSLLD